MTKNIKENENKGLNYFTLDLDPKYHILYHFRYYRRQIQHIMQYRQPLLSYLLHETSFENLLWPKFLSILMVQLHLQLRRWSFCYLLVFCYCLVLDILKCIFQGLNIQLQIQLDENLFLQRQIIGYDRRCIHGIFEAIKKISKLKKLIKYGSKFLCKQRKQYKSTLIQLITEHLKENF